MFADPGLIPEPCTCCKADDALIGWHQLAWEIDPEMAVRAQRDDGIRGEDGTDEFLAEELDINRALARVWRTQGAQAKAALLSSVAMSYSPYQFQSTLDQVSTQMDNLFDDAQDDVAAAIRQALEIGAVSSGATIELIRSSPNTVLTEEALLRATRYYTNRFFRQTIVPAIMGAVDMAIEGVEATPLSAIHAAIAQHFRTVPYWGLVANVAASRGYHYGLLKGFQQQRSLAYRVTAIIDDHTSRICMAMNGREFLIADAVQVLEGLASDPDPDAAKTRTPWLKLSEIEGQTNAQLAARGFLVPPYHGRCRTTIVRI